MPSPDFHPADDRGSSSVPAAERGGRRPRRRRVLRVAGIAVLAVVALLLVSTALNAILQKREQSRFTPYGERVAVTDGTLNVWRNGHTGPTLVLLSGLGTAAPAIDFAPLVRRLDAYDVIVVEGLGYGYSDMSGPPRTVQNVTTELHQVLSKLGVAPPYVLAGHSIAGFYLLSYAHQYPADVSAIVGIDPTVPAAKAGSTGTAGLPVHALGATVRMTGLVRLAYTLLPGLVEPKGNAYTPDERAQMHAMAIWNFGNAAVSDEINRTGSNASALHGVTYPDDLPVLEFLATDSVKNDRDWVRSHEDQLQNVTHHEIVVLSGDHYLHWTQSRVMAEKITAFLDKNLGTGAAD